MIMPFNGTRMFRVLGYVCLGIGMVLTGCQPAGNPAGGNGDDFLSTGRTQSHFSAIQVDPKSEDSAGPQFVVAEDVNDDGLLDIVSAWNQSQPVQIHLQRRDEQGAIGFEALTLAGNMPVVLVSGLAVADFDNDGHMDIVVLVKDTAIGGSGCLDSELPDPALDGAILVYFGPDDPSLANRALAWEEVPVGSGFLQGKGDETGSPEVGGFTSLSVGDMDLNGTTDLVVAWNSDCGELTTDAVIFSNPGPTQVRDGTWVGFSVPDSALKGDTIKDTKLADIDGDGDLDVVATFPAAPAMNVRWYRNPVVDQPDDFHISNGNWQVGTVGQIATGADVLKTADIDNDGIVDVVVRSSEGAILQWLKGPPGPTTSPLRNLPWQVYTLAEFTDRVPQAIATGDLTQDQQADLIVAAQGGLVWFDSDGADSVFDHWQENPIIDEGTTTDPNAVDPTAILTDPTATQAEPDESTLINSILVADIDGDGANDIIVTIDRSEFSGLSNDALVWFRNIIR